MQILSDGSTTVKPGAQQPGSLFQQTTAVAIFLADELRDVDREAAWQAARRRAIPHAAEGRRP